jgi:hypothetical protein
VTVREALSARVVMQSARDMFVVGLILAFYLMIFYLFSVEKGWITWNLRFSQAGASSATRSFALGDEEKWHSG